MIIKTVLCHRTSHNSARHSLGSLGSVLQGAGEGLVESDSAGMGLISGARGIFMKRVHDFIDTQVTKQLKPFLENGIGQDGAECSDFVVDEQGDMSLENMIVKPSVVNDTLIKAGSPYRVTMVRAKRIAVDIPWENFSTGVWKLEVEDLMVVVRPNERGCWTVDDLKKAKEASVESALAALVKKLKSLDAKPKKG